MNKGIKILLLDENDFRKKEKAVRKYNMSAYKQLTFDIYPALKKGSCPGVKVDQSVDKKQCFIKQS